MSHASRRRLDFVATATLTAVPVVRGILVVVGAALALRIAHVFYVAGYQLTNVVPGMDRWVQMEVARAVADGDVLGGPLAGYESGPAYALVLGLMYRAAGGSWLGPLLFQALLGALTPLLLTTRARSCSLLVVMAARCCPILRPVEFPGLTVKYTAVPFTA